MKFRNRGKHGFKRLKRQMRVYDYCLENISNHREFALEDITKDLGIPKSTVLELLKELMHEGKLFYKSGYIEIAGVGNNGINPRIISDRDGLKIRKMTKREKTHIKKEKMVYEYLCDLVNNNKELPCLSELYKSNDFYKLMHISTLSTMLKKLDRDEKIIYRDGKILGVYVKDIAKEKENGKTYKASGDEPIQSLDTSWQPYTTMDIIDNGEKLTYVNQPINIKNVFDAIETPIETPINISIPSTTEEDFDKAVKEVVTEYISKSSITTRQEIVDYVNAIMRITDRVKNKLFKSE